MVRPQQHLRAVADASPEPNGTVVILPLIAEGLRRLNESEQAERKAQRGDSLKKNPHVSDAGKCERRVVFSLMNIPETNPPGVDSLLRFALGHAFEDAIAKILEAYQGATYIREERVELIAPDGTKISGRKDFDAVRMLLDGDTMLELKSSNARSVGWLVKRGAPNEDHVAQLNLYLHATDKKVGYLVYLVAGSTKGEPVLHAWRVDYDAERADADIAFLADADAKAKVGDVPKVPQGYTQWKFPCGYCQFQKLCWGADSALEAQLAASVLVAALKAEASA